MNNRQEVLDNNIEIAICGAYFGNDSIHVGVYWNLDTEQKIFHFLSGQNIPIQDVQENDFENYFFNPLLDFPDFLLPSLISLSELISENQINNFKFKREDVIYNGGKFEFNSGNFNAPEYERIINCGVFVVALLNTYDYVLINWQTWPNQLSTTYLNHWLARVGIPQNQWSDYYIQVKQIRGKHIIVSPSTISKPSHYNDAEYLANQLIGQLNP